jgi:hypothetical protein
MNPQDNPHFTAYALGELSAEEARELHQMLAATPGAAHELEQIEAVTDALRHGAPIPQSRLTHEQRHAVLHPSSLPRRIQPMKPRQMVRAPRRTFWPVMGVVLKAAAVVALSGAAFLAGWKFSPVVQDAAAIAATPAKDRLKSDPVGEEPKEVRKTEAVPAQVAEVKAPDPGPVIEKPVAPVLVAAVEPAKAKPVIKEGLVKKEIVVVETPVPAPVVAEAKADLGFTMSEGRGLFANTTKQTRDEYRLQPGLIKPAPPKARGEVLASPQTGAVKPDNKPAKVSEIYIHSWKSEVATCPWNPAHRLLRIVILLPADQAAVTSIGAAFPLQVSFDPAHVKQFRMLGERHLAAAELRSAGTHVLWYEFQPNGAGDVVRDRQIASVTLPNARFTSQTVGPFDSSKLQVIDRGYSLQNAREDFVFESSVVGFGMLLRGTEHVGSLNHALVLDLARKAKGADANGERTRFIRVVQDAQRVAGL